MIWGSGGSKIRLAKAAGVEPAGQMRGEKLHAVVARSTFWSQNVQNTPGPDHFWKLRCRKSARRCGAKHICKSKCTNHTRFGPLLEVEMSKKCTPLWREAHFEVKVFQTLCVRTTFGRSEFVSRGRRKGLCTFSKVSKTWGFCIAFSTTTTTTPHYTPIHYATTTATPSLHSTTLHSTTLNYTQLHYTTLHYTTLSTFIYTPLHYITLHYTPLHSTTLQLQLHSTTLHSTTRHYTTLHYIPLHSSTLHYTTLHYIPLHYTTFHYTTLHYTNYKYNYKYNYNYNYNTTFTLTTLHYTNYPTLH